MSKPRQTAYQRACKRIETDGRKHCFNLYGATAIALWNHWGKRKDTITRLFDMSRDVWRDCAKDHDHSMIEMCEVETGIEIQNESGTSWRDVPYLNGSLDPGELTDTQWLYMKQQQIKWIRPQIMACMMVALHRKYGFGFDRCARIYQQIQEIEQEYSAKPERIRRACFELTGIDVADVVTRKGDYEQTGSES